MKNIFKTFLLIIFTIVLLVGILVVGYAVYVSFTSEDNILEVSITNTTASIEDTSETEKIRKNKDIGSVISDIFTIDNSAEKIEYSSKASDGKFYYEQLSENQKIIYNGLQEHKNNMISGTYVIQYGDLFSNILKEEDGTKKLQADYQAAVEAYTHDNPDLFYLDISKLYLNIETTKKMWNTKYNVYVGPETSKNYYNSEFLNEAEVRAAINQIENVKNSVLNKLSSDTYKNVKYIHDFLINNIEYDQTYNAKGTYTIYGALVGRTCVCDGYARAFKYLTNAAGIECELIQGTATNTNGASENHAWNAAKLNNRWYYLDVTWDDPVIVGKGYVPNSYYYRYFLKGSGTLKKDHVTNGQFSTEGKTFTYPTVSVTDY